MEYKNIAVGMLISLLPNFSHAIVMVDLSREEGIISRLRSVGCEDNAQLRELVSGLRAYSSVNLPYLIKKVRQSGYNAHAECAIMQELCKNNETALVAYATSEYERS